MAADLSGVIHQIPCWGDPSMSFGTGEQDSGRSNPSLRVLQRDFRDDVVSRSNVSLAIGNHKVYDAMKQILGSSGVVVTEEESQPYISWNRDHVVVRLDGSLMVPALINPSQPPGEITELVQTVYHYSRYPRYGTGITEHCVPSHAQRLHLSGSCIEGGNIKFFRLGQRTGAIIGASSVIHTARHMEEKGLFPGDIHQLMKEDLDRAAWIIVNCVLTQIAKDLNIEPDNLLVMEHAQLHIDLELLIDSNGKIFLHDPTLAEETLKYAQARGGSRSKIQVGIFENAFQDVARYAQSGIFERNKEKLETFGFQVIPVPGYFNMRGFGSGGQFLNGLLFEHPSHGKIFLSPSATFSMGFPGEELSDPYSHFLAERFSLLMKEHGISVIYVSCFGARGGGLHCLTREERADWRPGVPQTIPIQLESLPAFIPTQFQLIRPTKDHRQVSFTTHDPISKIVTEYPVEFDVYGICDMQLPVPSQGRLDYSVRIDGKLMEDPECYVLPGHPQMLNIDPTHWY
jgi:hypothetical protein